MLHRLLRPADRAKAALFSRLSRYNFKTLIQQQSQLHFQQSVQCDLTTLSQQTRGYISEIWKSAFKGNSLLRFLRNEIQYELVRFPSPQLRPALALNRPFSTNNKPKDPINNSLDKVKVDEVGPLTHHDSYRDLDKLDFMTAAEIYFKTPKKKKKFGLDFHLVQLFFACMPSLAVYLVAQYARSEMRRMDAELEVRNQAKEAKKEEMEQKVAEERARSDPQMLEVKVRLEKLEETVKEFVIESKKQSATVKNQEASMEQPAKTSLGNNGKKSELNNTSVKDHQDEHTSKERVQGSGPVETNQSAAATDASPQDQNATQGGNPSQDVNK